MKSFNTLPPNYRNKIHRTKSCWIWLGGTSKDKTGNRRAKIKSNSATRIIWKILVGNIPKEKFLCHKCNNALCVNPNHLYIGTQKDNMQDALKAGKCGRPAKIHPKYEKMKKLYLEGKTLYRIEKILKLNHSSIKHHLRKGGVL